MGGVLFYKSEQVKEEMVEYDIGCGFPILPPFGAGRNPNDCIKSFNILNHWEGKVNVYYQLTNFYQNHKNYKKSRNDLQLNGADLSKD